MHSNKLSVAIVFSNSIFSMALQTCGFNAFNGFPICWNWWTNTYSWNRTAMFSPSPGILTSRHLHNTKALVEDVDPTRDLPTEPGETTVTECFVFAKPAQQHQNQSWTNSNIIPIQTTQEITISSMTWNQICTYVKSLWITSTKHMHRPVNVAPTCEIQYHVHQLGLLGGPVFWYPLRTSEQKFVFRHLHHPRTGKLKRWFRVGAGLVNIYPHNKNWRKIMKQPGKQLGPYLPSSPPTPRRHHRSPSLSSRWWAPSPRLPSS